jgi:hypothetical protein
MLNQDGYVLKVNEIMKLLLKILNCIFICVSTLTAQEYSLRFLGTNNNNQGPTDVDRVKIPLDNPHRPVDVGASDFTVEFWIKANPDENQAGGCTPAEWYFGNIIIDRDIFDAGDHGDYGVAICNRRIVVGVERLSNGSKGVVGNTIIDDGQWHHIAFTRSFSNGQIRLFVDGNLDGALNSSDASGDVSYRNGRNTNYPNSDPYIVFGAEKHDYPNSLYFKGWLDEVRISNSIRYTSSFTPPLAPFNPDSNTMALYHFNEGSGNLLSDSSGASGGPSNGEIKYGGNPLGPQWSSDSPFYNPLLITTVADTGPGSLRNAVSVANQGAVINFASSLQQQTINLTNGTIVLNKDLQLINANNSQINIQVSGSGPVFQIQNGQNITLRNLRLTGGNGISGRILNNDGNLIIDQLTLVDNTPGSGSGIINTGNISIIGNISQQ